LGQKQLITNSLIIIHLNLWRNYCVYTTDHNKNEKADYSDHRHSGRTCRDLVKHQEPAGDPGCFEKKSFDPARQGDGIFSFLTILLAVFLHLKIGCSIPNQVFSSQIQFCHINLLSSEIKFSLDLIMRFNPGTDN
jgi:hypothetical protein